MSNPGGRRLAAVVNDFGAINIDAALLDGAQDGVVSLKNGCICCSLQGDLMRTLSTILRRDPVPDGIIIETSGISDPAEIVKNLLDPVIWKEASLDAVITVADAWHLTDTPALFNDTVLRAQLRAADFIALNKADLVTPEELQAVRERLTAFRPSRLIFNVVDGSIPPGLLFSGGPTDARAPLPPASRFTTTLFQSMTWEDPRPLSLPHFQQAIGHLAPRLLRAKGFLTLVGQKQRVLFQLVGERATVSQVPAHAAAAGGTQLVLIGRSGSFDEAQVKATLEACIAGQLH